MHRRNFITLSILAAAGLNIGCSKRKTTSSFDAERIEALISGWMVEFKVPGLSVAFIQKGEMIWNQAFGVRNTITNEPVDIDTLFEAASISKTVFSYAVMKLVQDGVIALDKPLSEYYPGLFVDGDPRLKQITARQVLSHSTGLPNWRSENPLTLSFDPGTAFNYSGEGFFLLQTVVSHLKGKIYDQPCGSYEAGTKVCASDIAGYMKQNVLVPNGMIDSTYEVDYPTAKNVATPHDQGTKPYQKNSFNPVDVARYASAGGLFTNAKEYSKFIINLIQARTLKEMFQPQSKLPKGEEIDGCQQWALGWGIKDAPEGRLIVHSGGQQGIRSLTMTSLEHRNGFIALTNGDNGGQVIYRLADALGPALFE